MIYVHMAGTALREAHAKASPTLAFISRLRFIGLSSNDQLYHYLISPDLPVSFGPGFARSRHPSDDKHSNRNEPQEHIPQFPHVISLHFHEIHLPLAYRRAPDSAFDE